MHVFAHRRMAMCVRVHIHIQRWTPRQKHGLRTCATLVCTTCSRVCMDMQHGNAAHEPELQLCLSACVVACVLACMHVCMYGCMYECVHVRVYLYMFVCMCACRHVCVQIQSWPLEQETVTAALEPHGCVCVHRCVYVYVPMHVCTSCIHMHTHASAEHTRGILLSHLCLCIHAWVSSVHAHRYGAQHRYNVYSRTHAGPTNKCPCISTYTYIYIYTYIHIY